MARKVAEFSATAAKLSPAARKRLIARKDQFKKLIAEIAAEPEAPSETLKLVTKSDAEVSQGRDVDFRGRFHRADLAGPGETDGIHADVLNQLVAGIFTGAVTTGKLPYVQFVV